MTVGKGLRCERMQAHHHRPPALLQDIRRRAEVRPDDRERDAVHQRDRTRLFGNGRPRCPLQEAERMKTGRRIVQGLSCDISGSEQGHPRPPGQNGELKVIDGADNLEEPRMMDVNHRNEFRPGFEQVFQRSVRIAEEARKFGIEIGLVKKIENANIQINTFLQLK